MPPPETSIIVGILSIIAVAVYIIILRKLKPYQTMTGKAVKEVNDDQPKTGKKNNDAGRQHESTTQSRKTTVKKYAETEDSESICFHEFGYLATLPKNAALPDECLACPTIMNCLTGKKPDDKRAKK